MTTTGTVKYWHNDKKFGFVNPDSGGESLFFHLSNCVEEHDMFHIGERVRYIEGPSRARSGKNEAFDVELI
jgi:cold shock CspA family protein